MFAGTETAIGIDVGGTRIRAARIDRAGTILERVIEPVASDRDGFCTQLLRLVGEVRDQTSNGVGVGIPGRVDADRGAIKSTGNLDIAGLDLPGLVAMETGLPLRIENDATMALLAEAHTRKESSGVLLMVTVGTGIGGATFIDGAPWYGGGHAGQFGHIVVAEDGPICNCGRRGCVETFSSGTALRHLVSEAGLRHDIQVEELLAQRSDGGKISTELLDRWARPFQRALESLVSVIDPELIVIGGGLGAGMMRALERIPNESDWYQIPLVPALLGDDAGMIGAGLRCFSEQAP